MKHHSFKIYFLIVLLSCFATSKIKAQDVTVTVNATANKKAVSPAIYGRNEGFDIKSTYTLTKQYLKDAGLRFARVGGGNNMSAYNWRLKLTVHPDYMNNVYGEDWDAYANKINNDFSDLQGMFAFQLLGRAASSSKYNFADYAYKQAHPGWYGFGQNLAGNGTPNPDGGSKALVDGDSTLFSVKWPADSTVAILTHWFGTGGLGYNKDKFKYWSMDNEPDCWGGTHDWVMTPMISASAFMDRFIELAYKAKALYPGIKICGPVATSEWFWYKWGSNESIRENGKYYTWIQYVIHRCGQEYKKTGIKLIDVIDIHNYPYFGNTAEALQLHRIYFDTNYDYPGANGIKTLNGGWDALSKEYIFKRFNDWCTTEFGPNHGITSGVSEWSPGPSEPNLVSVIYASHLGTFANNGVELFTPWNWFTGMWETLHLFSRYAKGYSVSSTSSIENTVSAYTTVNQGTDSMTVIIVNRDTVSSRNVTVNLSNFPVANGNYSTLQLSSLPTTETFVSHTKNALKLNSVTVNSNTFTIIVPSLSVTAVVLKSTPTGVSDVKSQRDEIKIFPNPATDKLSITIRSNIAEPTEVIISDQSGRKIQSMAEAYDGSTPITLNVSSLSIGYYLLTVKNNHCLSTRSFIVSK
ncbi:MAG: glycoside hydrolase family 44 protein [Paludibacter sp.]|nr:glycoside hydrolase family 44 protein [Paludibacter sp.]